MEALEPNMYVRAKDGTIHKIFKIDKMLKYKKEDRLNINKDDWFLVESDLVKASHNIVDLIEVGDYVNGEKITRVIPQDICGDEVLDYQHIFVNDKEIFKHEINSIVTKKQFESMKYEVK